MSRVAKFLDDCSGGITIDWVALTAGVLLVGIMVVYALYNNGVSSAVSSINNTDAGFGTTASLLHTDNINAD